MTERKLPIGKLSKNVDVPILLRGNIRAFLIVIGRVNPLKRGIAFSIYYILEKGRLFLYDKKDVLGSRNAKVKFGDIVCLWKNRYTGHEEFGGYLDKNGISLSKVEPAYEIPVKYIRWVQDWYEERKVTLSMIRKGKLKISKEIFDIKKIQTDF